MDTISAYLNGMRIRSFEAGYGEARAPWGVAIPGGKWDIVFYLHDGAPYQISLPPLPGSLLLRTPSIIMVLNGRAHLIQDHLKSRPDPSIRVDMNEPHTIEQFRFKSLGGETGPLTTTFYMGLDLGGWGTNPLLEALPKLLTLELDAIPPWFAMGWSWLKDEMLAQRAGRHSTAARLGELLIIEAVRSYVDQHRATVPPWLRPAQDCRLTRALALLHGNLSRDWTLADLAAMSGTSRSRLTVCAQTELGEGIFRYLQRWRMFEACRLLRETDFKVARIGHLVGYAAQNAFITAFGRIVGVSPSRYRREAAARFEALVPDQFAWAPLRGPVSFDRLLSGTLT